jgi:hypothetical protein
MREVAIALAACVVFAVAGAEAQGDAKAQAKEAFAEGKSLFDQGKHSAAAAAFREAYRLLPSWKVYYNIGQCEALAKRHGLALEAFEAYLAQGGDDVPEARREEVLDEVERLRKMVGSVDVTAPDGAVVMVDGLERGQTPLPGPLIVAAGVNHKLVVEVGGDVLVERTVRVSGGQTVEVKAGAVAGSGGERGPDTGDEPLQPESIEESEKEGDPLATAGWVTLGVGGALLIGGAITGGVALSLNKDLESECSDGICPKDQWDKNDKMKAMGVTTDVLIGVGAAAAATGIVLLIVSATGDEDQDGGEVALVPTVGPGFAGAGLQGRF